MKIDSYKDLLVWQKSIELVGQIYKLAAELPASEKFELAGQMQRAAVSVSPNIAESYKRNGLAEYIQFCSIAAGSLAELETQNHYPTQSLSQCGCRASYAIDRRITENALRYDKAAESKTLNAAH